MSEKCYHPEQSSCPNCRPAPSPLPWVYETPVKLSEKGIYLGMHYQLMSDEHDWNSKDPQVLGYAKTHEDAELIMNSVNSYAAHLALIEDFQEAVEKMKAMLPKEATATESYMCRSGLLDILAKSRKVLGGTE